MPVGAYRPLDAALVDGGLPLLAIDVPQNAVTAAVPLLAFSPDHVGAVAIRSLAAELIGDAADRRSA